MVSPFVLCPSYRLLEDHRTQVR